MKQAEFTLPALLALAIAACQQPADTNIAIDNGINSADAAIETLPPSEESGDANMVGGPNEADDGGSENSAPTAVIPAQYRGRWGMVAADCTSTRGDAKGLINVGDTKIRFYESTASLQEQRPAIATSFSGVFVVTGEGQIWERVMTLTRTGDKLKRADADGSYNYTRCA